jgi:hypothetical protein
MFFERNLQMRLHRLESLWILHLRFWLLDLLVFAEEVGLLEVSLETWEVEFEERWFGNLLVSLME